MRTYIPNHIIFGDILPLVPSEKLNEWKVACKSWYYHLHLNPSYFIKDQLAKSRGGHIFDIEHMDEFHQHHNFVSTTLYVEFEHDSTTKTINGISRTSNLSNIMTNIGLSRYGTVTIGSCNGLVLVNQYGCPEFHLINPSTNQWVTLPPPYKRNKVVVAVFGYDKSSDKYKVLLIIQKKGFQCKLLTLGSKNWKSIILPHGVKVIRRQSVTTEGYMNLLCSVDGSEAVFNYLLSFDICRETFQLLKLPTIATSILDVHDSLAMVPINGSSYMYYKLFDRNNETWIKEYSIPLTSLTRFIHPYPNRYFPLMTCNGGNTFIFEEVVGGLYYFDNENLRYKEIKPFWDRSRNSRVTYSLNHVDTLLSPYTVMSKKEKYLEDPDSAILLRRSLRLQKKSILKRV